MSLLQSPFAASLIGKAGKAISTVGSAIHAPQLAPGGLGSQLQSYGGYFSPPQAHADYSPSGPTANISNFGNKPGVDYAGPAAFQSYAQGGAAPSTGGQPAAPSGGSPAPSGPSSSDQSYLDSLRGAYNNVSQNLQSLAPGLDDAFNKGQSAIQASVDQNQQGANDQKANLDSSYGDALKGTVQTYNDLGRQRQGTFSALGSLDSSAYQDATLKGQQELTDNQAKLTRDQSQQKNAVDTAFNTYKQNATSQIAGLAQQYQQGKVALANAISNNDLNSAQAIQSAISGIQSQAQQIQQNILNFGLKASELQAQGFDVGKTISSINGSQFLSPYLQQLASAKAIGNNTYVTPSTGTHASGYIGTNNKSTIDPRTGLPIQ